MDKKESYLEKDSICMRLTTKIIPSVRFWLGIFLLAVISIAGQLNLKAEFEQDRLLFRNYRVNQADFFYGYDQAFECVKEAFPAEHFIGVYQSRDIREEQQKINVGVAQYYLVPSLIYIDTPMKYLLGYSLRPADISNYNLENYTKIMDCPGGIAIYQDTRRPDG